MKTKTSKRKLLLRVFILILAFRANGQQVCVPNLVAPLSQFSQFSSYDYDSKYGTQAYWTPVPTDPLVTIKLTIHVIQPNGVTPSNLNGAIWVDDAGWPSPSPQGRQALIDRFAGNSVQSLYPPYGITNELPVVNGNSDQYSAGRQANYPAPFQLASPQIPDSRIKYEITNIYYYADNTQFNSGSAGSICTFIINSLPPGVGSARLDEGLPILLAKNGPWTSVYNGAPIILTNVNQDVDWFRQNIRHEMGHAMGLYHTLSSNSCCMENADCASNPDFLNDVFPLNNTAYCTGGANLYTANGCNTCNEWNNNQSNNFMCEGSIGPRLWMSPLQMARRRRAVHIYSENPVGIGPAGSGTSHADIRKFVKDRYSDHIYPHVINQSETWDFDIQMYRDILVKQGNTLTIRCKVKMAIEGKIQVEKGAQLIIDGGEVTGWCKTGLWGSIQVAGNPSLNQTIYTSGALAGYSPNQGVLRIINAGKVTHSANAITNYLTYANNSIDWGSGGGIIIANGAIFENNCRAVEFLAYSFPSASKFENCQFKTSGAIGLKQPNLPGIPFAHVSMWGTNGIQFKGCKFEYSAGNMYQASDRGMGIYSIDAMYTVDQFLTTSGPLTSTFIKMNTGVYVGNYNPLKVVTIVNSEFVNNERDGVHFENMQGFVLEKNQFTTPGNGYTANGLYLDKCKNYNVRLNTFKQSSSSAQMETGIYVYDSGSGSHEIYGNTFSNFLIGICPEGSNSSYPNTNNPVFNGLRMNCNNFAAGSPNQYDIAMLDVGSVPATASIWQSNFNNTNPAGLVRNIYSASPICSNCENRWYIDNNSVQQMFHYNHNDAFARVTPQPNYSDASLLTVNVLWLNMTNYVSACPGVQGGRYAVPRNQLAAFMNTNIAELREDNKDGHNDQEITETISAKLNFFLTDSVYTNADSVLSVFSSYPNELENSDVMRIFTYMYKQEYSLAEDAINNLPSTRSDWQSLLAQMVYLEQHPDELYGLASNSTLNSMFETYATTEGMDGQGSAKAIMEMVNGRFYEVPRLAPSQGSGSKPTLVNQITGNGSGIYIYPNPGKDMMYVSYQNPEESTVDLILIDPQGRKIYETSLKSGSEVQIPVKEFSEGVYFLNAYKGKESVHRTKFIVVK